MASRILDVIQVRFLATQEIGTSGNFEEIIFNKFIGDTIEDVVIERMQHFVGEGLYLQNSTVGVLFIPESHIYGVLMAGDASIPAAKTLGARY